MISPNLCKQKPWQGHNAETVSTGAISSSSATYNWPFAAGSPKRWLLGNYSAFSQWLSGVLILPKSSNSFVGALIMAGLST